MTDLDQDRPVPGDPLRRALVSGRWDHEKHSSLERVAKTHENIDDVEAGNEISVLLVRDGRDVMVSYYNYKKNIEKDNQSLRTKVKQKVKNVFEKDDGFKNFVEEKTEEWAKHVCHNIDVCDVLVKYERLNQDDEREIKRIANQIKISVNDRVVERASDLFSFENLSGGRSKGEEDSNSHFRKGKSKDWVNWFEEEHLAIFERAGGLEALRKAGYDPDA